jgi:hypothetical protein
VSGGELYALSQSRGLEMAAQQICARAGGEVRLVVAYGVVSVRSGAFNERVDEGTGFSGFFKFFCVLSRSEQRQTTTMSVGLWLKSSGGRRLTEVKWKQERSSAARLLFARVAGQQKFARKSRLGDDWEAAPGAGSPVIGFVALGLV